MNFFLRCICVLVLVILSNLTWCVENKYQQHQNENSFSQIIQFKVENNKLKARLKAIEDSLKAKAIYDKSVALQNKEFYENKEKQYILQQKKLKEKELQLKTADEKRKNLVISCIAFLVTSVFTIIYMRQRSLLLYNQKSHRAEIAIQQEKELSHRLLLEKIKSRIEAQEAERERIARELHDGVGGNLVAIRLQLQALDDDNPYLINIQKLVAQTHEEIRSISHNLATPRLDEIPFEQLFSHHLNHLKNGKDININGVLLPTSGWSSLDLKFQTDIFRLIQELTANVIKHSNASKVSITLRREENNINIIVEDNGIGFCIDSGFEGIGLQNIKLRVSGLEGKIDITSNLGKGSVFFIDIPLKS